MYRIYIRLSELAKPLLALAFSLYAYRATADNLPKNLFAQVDRSKMKHWADSVYRSLSEDERLAQLIMPIVYPSAEQGRITSEEQRIRQYKWGGILYQKGLLHEQFKMNERLQRASQTPMLIALDGEWGLYMRLKDAPRYPRNLGLGLNEEDATVYSYGREVARQCRLMGIHINFAPTVDVNINPQNPVIGSRSFGDKPSVVSKMSVAYAQGLEDGGVLSVAKHFPGHGDTSEDSHKTLPLVRADRKRLEQVELAPFRSYIAQGLGGVMTAHLRIPTLEPSQVPSSLSRRITTDLLQRDMGFGGLIFTDGLEMRGVHAGARGDVGVAALKAGNDILLGPPSAEAQLRALRTALSSGELDADEIRQKVMKVLYYKYRLIISQAPSPAKESDLKQRIWTPEAEREMRSLWLKSLYFLQGSLPKLQTQLSTARYKRIAVVGYGSNPISSILRPRNTKQGGEIHYLSWEGFEAKATQYDFILVNAFSSKVPSEALLRIARERPLMLVYYTTPFRLPANAPKSSLTAVVLAMEAAKEAQEAVLSIISGDTAIPSRSLSDGASSPDKSDAEDPTAQMTARPQAPRPSLSTISPKGLRQVNKAKLTKLVDSIVQEGLQEGAFPGCQVYVMQGGKEVFNKAYGSLEGTPSRAVTPHTLYDIASVSKALGTTPAVMALVADGKLKLSDRVSSYLPELEGTFAGGITIRNLLLHQSGLAPGLPFANRLFSPLLDEEGRPYYADRQDKLYSLRLCHKYYVRPDYRTAMQAMIASASPRKLGQYVYSDLNFILLGWVVERISGQSLEDYLTARIWQALGSQVYYNPLDKGIALESIAPAQRYDQLRSEKIRATVDDESAACLGGVAGNAGIFASARELAKIAQLILDKGRVGTKQIISQSVVEQFLSARGVGGIRCMGFIRPQWGKSANQAAESASDRAVGHYGFTGTAVWIDPSDQLVFVFLSNRTYTGRSNTRISRNRYRPRLHQAVYDSME